MRGTRTDKIAAEPICRLFLPFDFHSPSFLASLISHERDAHLKCPGTAADVVDIHGSVTGCSLVDSTEPPEGHYRLTISNCCVSNHPVKERHLGSAIHVKRVITALIEVQPSITSHCEGIICQVSFADLSIFSIHFFQNQAKGIKYSPRLVAQGGMH